MTREIKFRAWNKIWKMMSMVDKIEFEDGNPYRVSTTIEATDFDHTDEWSDYEVGDEIILQQFTGLKDKNGKEIYEGDIVKFRHNAENVIGGQSEIGKIKYYTESLCFGLNTGEKESDWWNYDNYDMFDFEVIGNIFENPELINHPLTYSREE